MPELFDPEFLSKAKEGAENLRVNVQTTADEREAKVKRAKRKEAWSTVFKIVVTAISLAGTLVGTLAAIGLWPWR